MEGQEVEIREADFPEQRKFPWRSCGFVAAIVIAILIIAAMAIPSLLCARRAAWQSRAKGTLRSIGSSQIAFKGANQDNTYGTFDELKAEPFIADGFTLDNIIENYTMEWEVNNFEVMESGENPEGINSTFTIIAFPRNRRPGYLQTFAITDDQVVRVFNPDGENDFDTVNSWDPIL
jgi:type II secretory pathway pseudopilin PulG